MKKKLVSVGLLIAVLSFGLGALSRDLVVQVLERYVQQYYQDENLRDMFGPGSSEAYWYFTGRMEARLEDFVTLRNAESTGVVGYRPPTLLLEDPK